MLTTSRKKNWRKPSNRIISKNKNSKNRDPEKPTFRKQKSRKNKRKRVRDFVFRDFFSAVCSLEISSFQIFFRDLLSSSSWYTSVLFLYRSLFWCFVFFFFVLSHSSPSIHFSLWKKNVWKSRNETFLDTVRIYNHPLFCFFFVIFWIALVYMFRLVVLFCYRNWYKIKKIMYEVITNFLLQRIE